MICGGIGSGSDPAGSSIDGNVFNFLSKNRIWIYFVYCSADRIYITYYYAIISSRYKKLPVFKNTVVNIFYRSCVLIENDNICFKNRFLQNSIDLEYSHLVSSGNKDEFSESLDEVYRGYCNRGIDAINKYCFRGLWKKLPGGSKVCKIRIEILIVFDLKSGPIVRIRHPDVCVIKLYRQELRIRSLNRKIDRVSGILSEFKNSFLDICAQHRMVVADRWKVLNALGNKSLLCF